MQAFQDIFISYGRKDSLDFASRLNSRLVTLGFTVWFDYDDIPLGVDYQKQIDDGIERADNFLFVISPHSINSPYCGLEIELALKCCKRIIPILHVERINYETWQARNPNGTDHEWAEYQEKGLHDHFQNMPPILRKLNWVWMREGLDDFEASFQGLLELIQQHKDYVHTHTRLLAKALDWERHQKRSPYLLIGEERLRAEQWLMVRFQDCQPPCVPTDLHSEFITESRKNADNLLTDIFLAYAEENRDDAERIRRSLWREGFTVWSSKSDIPVGMDFQEAINRGIEGADSIVYLLSPAAIASSWCQHELDYALSLHKRIIPVLAEAIAPDHIPLPLKHVQYIDLTDNQQESDYDLDESQLLQVLRHNADYHETHKLLLTKALKWNRHHQNPTFLLRGYNLRHAEAWLTVAKNNTAYPPLSLHDTFIAESLRQPPGVALDVFISYSRADSGFARQINDALQSQEKLTWFDQESIAAGTADFQAEIHQGIENSDIFLFILSPNSVNSPYCADEVEHAVHLNKRVVTLLYQLVDTSTLHPELAKVQWLDFRQPEEFSKSLVELMRVLEGDRLALRTHTRLLQRAIEWNDQDRRESLLLRGEDLLKAEQWLGESAGKTPEPTELQKTYITTSRSAENAQQQAQKILQDAAQKGKKLVMLGGLAGGVGLIIAIAAGIFAQQARVQMQVASMQAQSFRASAVLAEGRAFNALLIALEAGQKLSRNASSRNDTWNPTALPVMSALYASIHQVRESNVLEGHQGSVTSVIFSPDGSKIVSGGDDGTIRVWDAATGKELILIDPEAKETISSFDGISSISISPDGAKIISGSWDGTVRIWDMETGEQRLIIDGHENSVTTVTMSADGTKIASGDNGGTIKIWDIKTGTELISSVIKPDSEEAGIFINSLSFSPDGAQLISVSSDDIVQIWDVATGTEQLPAIESGQFMAIFSPDGNRLLFGSRDGTLTIWDAATRSEILTFETNHDPGLYGVSYSSDGTKILSFGEDTVQISDAATGDLLLTLEGHSGGVYSAAFSPDGEAVVSGGADNRIRLWDIETADDTLVLSGVEDWGESVEEMSPDGTRIAYVNKDGQIQIWDADTGQVWRSLDAVNANDDNSENYVPSIGWSSDNERIVVGYGDGTVHIRDAATGDLLAPAIQAHGDRVRSVRFSLDGTSIVSGGNDGTVQIWDARTGEAIIPAIAVPEKQFSSVNFSPDGTKIIAGDSDGAVYVWDAATGEQILETTDAHRLRVIDVQFSPDGEWLISISFDNAMTIWDANTGTERHTVRVVGFWPQSVDFNADGTKLVYSTDRLFKVINLNSLELEEILTFQHPTETWLYDVKFRRNEQGEEELISLGRDHSIQIWSLDIDDLMAQGCDRIRTYLENRPNEQHICKGYLDAEP